MPKLKILSGAELCRLFELNGFVNVRQRGNHRVMQKKTEGGTVVNGNAIPTQSGDAEKAGIVFAASEPGQGRAQPGEANP